MKKITFAIFAFCAILGVQAQIDESNQIKQFTGANNLEVQLAPLGGSPISIGGLRFRSFTSETSAFRLNAFLGGTNDTDKASVANAEGDDVILKSANSSLTIDLRPGIETHFAGTKRLSPYYGGEAVIGFKSSKNSVETFDADGTTVITNKVRNPDNNGYFRLGLNAILGADFYVARHLYLGTEVGFGLLWTIESDEVSVPNEGDTSVLTEGGTTFNLGPNAVGQIRLGFLF